MTLSDRTGPREGLRICIVGGCGKMGGWMARLFERSGHSVSIVDPASGNGLALDAAAGCDAVAVSAPISSVGGILAELDGICGDQLIFDVSSLKSPFAGALRDMGGRRRVCSVHPMFGPGEASIHGRNIIVCDCGSAEAMDMAEDLFGGRGAIFTRMPVEDHDRHMSYVLGLSHAVNIAFFTVLERSGIPFSVFENVASTTFGKSIDTNRSVALEDPSLYYEIQHLNSGREDMWREFSDAVDAVRRASLSDDPSEFRELMDRGRAFFTR
ncbi:MAG: prephenate dehydrogenase [Candidatus Methanoplasma sp.]|jgi:chorismate mutase/prephenate dehydrogenase|nr:prephenate dehydrogenase [Candidatus Methanoplasma sp.]